MNGQKWNDENLHRLGWNVAMVGLYLFQIGDTFSDEELKKKQPQML
jgi:hypothetical protein